MSDFNFGGTDEESAEIKKLNAEVVSCPYSSCDRVLADIVVIAREYR